MALPSFPRGCQESSHLQKQCPQASAVTWCAYCRWAFNLQGTEGELTCGCPEADSGTLHPPPPGRWPRAWGKGRKPPTLSGPLGAGTTYRTLPPCVERAINRAKYVCKAAPSKPAPRMLRIRGRWLSPPHRSWCHSIKLGAQDSKIPGLDVWPAPYSSEGSVPLLSLTVCCSFSNSSREAKHVAMTHSFH